MADKTGIEWTDATWNPTTGCDRVSPGCDHCYAMTLAPRLKAMELAQGRGETGKYQTDGDPRTSGRGFGYAEHATALDQPLRWTRPRRIFVNSMSDLFHGDATREFQAQVWAVMVLAHWHTFQVLTKRPGIMRSVLSSPSFKDAVQAHCNRMVKDLPNHPLGPSPWWPASNVHVGTSVESQPWALRRIPALLDTPAAVRFLSCEPLLGPVDLIPALERWAAGRAVQINEHLHWVIVGGESGKDARPMSPAWARQLRDQCQDAAVPFHFKQWGEWGLGDGDDQPGDVRIPTELGGSTYYLMRRHGKRAVGRVLDGRTWDEVPA